MKNIILIFASCIFAFACKKPTGVDSTSALKNEAGSFFNKNIYDIKATLNDYHNQPPLYNTGSNDVTEFTINNNLTTKLQNKDFDWRYFAALYNESLSVSTRQFLSYIILVNKDLINVCKQNPGNTDATNELKRQVSTLVSTKYIGYCVLYNALQTLESTDKSFTMENSKRIIEYAKQDQFSQNISKSAQNTYPGMKEKQKAALLKVAANYAFVQKINSLL